MNYTCTKCGKPADVLTDAVCLCARHYTEAIGNMRLNADGLRYDEASNTWREPTRQEAELAKKIKHQRMMRRLSSTGQRALKAAAAAAKPAMKHVSGHIGADKAGGNE